MPIKNNKTFRTIVVTAFSYPLFMMLFLPAVGFVAQRFHNYMILKVLIIF